MASRPAGTRSRRIVTRVLFEAYVEVAGEVLLEPGQNGRVELLNGAHRSSQVVSVVHLVALEELFGRGSEVVRLGHALSRDLERLLGLRRSILMDHEDLARIADGDDGRSVRFPSVPAGWHPVDSFVDLGDRRNL